MTATMTMTTDAAQFSHISAKPLHATFAAEIQGVDFSKPIPDYIFQEVLQALTKVCYLCYFSIRYHSAPN